MKKILLAIALSAQLFAGEQMIAPIEVAELEMLESESKIYMVVSGMMLLGDTSKHEEALLEGDRDYGLGIDVGYRLSHGFALEYDFTYSKNTVTETLHEEVEEAKATYYTSALDLVYTYEATERVGIFGKVGYEYEWEKISDYNIDNQEHDFVFGGGIEIAMNEKYKLIGEYEHSAIKGPHGDSLFAGIMLNF